MKNHEPYDEEKLAHQEPVQAISAWQEWNSMDSSEILEAGIEKDCQAMDTALYERDKARMDEDEVALAQRTVE